MGPKWLLTLVVGSVVVTAFVACSRPAEEDIGGGSSRVSSQAFNKNLVLTDTALRDSTAMTTADIQKFLDKTPWGKQSVLATYEEGGKTAAEIMHDAAEKNGINPLELLVRVQMEQGLINKTTASDETISIAFGCGCPHSPACSSKYEGFANQAECAAGTLRRSMDKAGSETGTVSGWKKGSEKATQDKVEIVPQNAATAALYTYTPWVGEAGGGKKGVGGASLHHAVWERFADATSYGVAPSEDGTSGNNTARSNEDAGTDATGPGAGEEEEEGTSSSSGASGTSGGTSSSGASGTSGGTSSSGASGTSGGTSSSGASGTSGGTSSSGASGTSGGTSSSSGSPTEEVDAGADAGKKKGDTSTGTPGSGTDDSDILGEGNSPPASNAPPPQSSSNTKGKTGGEEKATEADLASKKKADEGGCSSTGSRGGSDALAGLLVMGAAILASRRRRSA